MSIKERLGAALYDAVMKGVERGGLHQWRRQLLADARGDVLEIGIGTGANVPNYPNKVHDVIAVEPNPAMVERIETDAFGGRGRLRIVEGYAGDLPLEDDTVETAVSTLVLCSVPEPVGALREIRRVLKPDGRLLFLEHVASPDRGVRRWQDRLDPIWYWLTGDCHMNRRTADAIQEAGFVIEECVREPMPRAPSLIRPTIRGSAVPDVRD